ncbi:MAG: glutathione S-transferase family protein [Curvibacter sp.]|nr:MAG: glutathione S-transferase family protein [Curvibacter sp.]
MTVHIWGRLSSLNVRKVVWAAQETGIAFTRSDAGMAFGVVKTPEYLAMNPNALVPTLQDGDFTLWESNAIVRYLCAKYGNEQLYPQDLAARFDAERWMDWQQTTLNRESGGAFLQWVRTPADKRDPAVISRSTASTEPALAQLNTHLADRAWMCGEHFSMADIPVACDVHRWFALPQPRPAWPHLERWFAAILERPATRGVLDLPIS